MKPQQLADAFNRNVGVLEVRLRDFLNSGDPANTQALRRAVRRLVSSNTVLPKDVRQNGRFKEYFKELEKLSKTTGDVRDLDTISARVAEVSSAGDWRSMVAEIAKMRLVSLRAAMGRARELEKMKVPRVDAGDLSERKLDRRLAKRRKRLEKRVDDEFEDFLSSQKVEVMHGLRKDSKRLRHLLELTGKNGNENLLKQLRSIQDELGAIRDHDLVIGYLRGRVKLASTRALVREEIARRHAGLEDFMTKYRGQARAIPA